MQKTRKRVSSKIVHTPREYYKLNKLVMIGADVMFVAGVPFFVTYSRKIKFTTGEFLPRRSTIQLANSLQKLQYLYAHGGFVVRLFMMDREFEPTKDLVHLVKINTTAARKYVGLIERKIHVTKKKTRASSSQFLFVYIPVMVLIHTVYTMIVWLNAFPNMSKKHWFSHKK